MSVSWDAATRERERPIDWLLQWLMRMHLLLLAERQCTLGMPEAALTCAPQSSQHHDKKPNQVCVAASGRRSSARSGC